MAVKKKPASAKSPAARMGMTEAEHRAHMKGGKGGKGMKTGKPMKSGRY